MIHAFGPTSKEPHSQCSPRGLPHSRKSISWLVTRGPETTEEHQRINHLSALTHCFRSYPIQDSAKCQKGTDTPSRSLSPASLGSKAPCFHPSHPLTLLSKMNFSQACSFSTSLIRFLLWSCGKQGGSWADPREDGTTCRPLPPKFQTPVQEATVFTVNLGPVRLKMWRTPSA